MDCNKDEAVRAREISQKKLLERDFAGAQKFALKAQKLYPNLEGISPLFDVINVYMAEKNKIHGEVDYYKVFGVDPSANEELLQKQYMKLALALHPDKNNSVEADGAFKIFLQAWSVLSDKDKRREYNSRLNRTSVNLRPSAESVNQQNQGKYYGFHNFGGSSSSSTANDPPHVPTRLRSTATPTGTFQNIPPRVPTRPRSTPTPTGAFQNIPAPKETSQDSASPTTNSSPNVDSHQKMPSTATDSQFIPRDPEQGSSSHPSTTKTFWTVCRRCLMQYEFETIFLNQKLICCHCCRIIIAVETPAPDLSSRSSRLYFYHGKGPFTYPSSSQSVPVSASRDTRAAAGPTVPPSNEKLKRKHEETENVVMGGVYQHQSSTGTKQGEACSYSETHHSCLNKENQFKKRRTDGQNQNNGKEGVQGTAGSSSCLNKASVNLEGDSTAQPDVSSKGGSLPQKAEIKDMMMAMAKKEMQHKLDKWNTTYSKSSGAKKVETKTSENAPEEDPVNDTRKYEKNPLHPSKSSIDTDDDANETVSISVPDADFHNFDNDRVESSFARNQVWATYDNDDGMPRNYSVIQQVISQTPFKIRMRWLNSKNSSEFGSLKWTQLGCTQTCGDFRAGKYMIMDRLNSFSHLVKWRKGLEGAFQIFPEKGDVWALYQNWSPDWDVLTKDDIKHKYDLVIVLEDYTINTGAVVMPLVKVPGFTSLFRQHLDRTEARRIPSQEMFRFSHHVPSYMLNEEEGCNVTNNCYELDPAALPLDLLKVIKGDDDEKEKGEKAAEDPSQSTCSDSSMGRLGVVLTYSRQMKGKNKVQG